MSLESLDKAFNTIVEISQSTQGNAVYHKSLEACLIEIRNALAEYVEWKKTPVEKFVENKIKE